MAAATLWGISGVVAKALFNRQIEPGTLVEIRLTAAFVLLLIILVLRRIPLRVPRSRLGGLLLLGLAMALAQFTYYLTVSLTNVSTAIFLQYTAPAFVALYGWTMEREPLTAVTVAGIVLAIGGSYLLVVGVKTISVSPPGLLSGVFSAVAFGLYAIIGRRRVQEVGSWPALLYALGSGALVWSFIVPPWRAYLANYALTEWALFAFIVLFATVLPFGLFLYGLRVLSSSLTSLTATLEPVVASTTAALVLGEAITARQALGGLCIVAAVAILQVADLLMPRQKALLPPAPD